ncbi:MAG: hypothetical protein C4318_02020 [Acidimicrobiia bacterium]
MAAGNEHTTVHTLSGGEGVTKEKTSMGTQTAVEELYELTKKYVRQETIDPLRSLARRLGYGALGAVCVGVGCILVATAILRLVPRHLNFASRGLASSLVYFAVALVLLGFVRTSWKIMMKKG